MRKLRSPLIGVACLLGDRHFGSGDFQARGGLGIMENDHRQILLVMGIGHSLNLGQEAGHIAGAAGGSEPGSPPCRPVVEGIFPVRLQGVDVEEAIALQVDGGQDVVEKGNLRHVEVLGVPMGEKHPEVEEHVADCGAGLVEGVRIGEEVGRSETLDPVDCPEPAGDMHPGVRHVGPDSVKGAGVGILVFQVGQIRHGRVEIGGPHGMPDGFALVLDGGMLLGVGGGHHAFPIGHVGFAPNLEKLLRHFQVELLARHLVKLDQGQLHLLVAKGLAGWACPHCTWALPRRRPG